MKIDPIAHDRIGKKIGLHSISAQLLRSNIATAQLLGVLGVLFGESCRCDTGNS